ncbi:MAG: hypothetical protein AAF616_01920, partial [Bacteroidota bacterium]
MLITFLMILFVNTEKLDQGDIAHDQNDSSCIESRSDIVLTTSEKDLKQEEELSSLEDDGNEETYDIWSNLKSLLIQNKGNIVLLGGQLLIAFIVSRYTKKRRKSDLTLKMLDRWTSEAMRIHRLKAGRLLTELKKASLGRGKGEGEENKFVVHLGHIRDEYYKDYSDLSEVFHFFSDLYTLLGKQSKIYKGWSCGNQINVRLARKLFTPTISSYYFSLAGMDYRSYELFEKNATSIEKKRGERQVHFFETEVAGLIERLKMEKVQGYLRETKQDSKLFQDIAHRHKSKENTEKEGFKTDIENFDKLYTKVKNSISSKEKGKPDHNIPTTPS